MDELSRSFPQGVQYQVVYDPTTNVREGIREVAKTLFEAILLVVIVVVLFLQTWRASVIPLVAVPVSVVGTFAVMRAFGFSINTLSLSPALSAILLRKHGAAPDRLTRALDFLFGWLFRRFNRLFARGSDGYSRLAGRVVRRRGRALVVYAALVAVTVFAFSK